MTESGLETIPDVWEVHPDVHEVFPDVQGGRETLPDI